MSEAQQLGRTCTHGQLTRQCELCDVQAQLDAAQAQVAAAVDLVRHIEFAANIGQMRGGRCPKCRADHHHRENCELRNFLANPTTTRLARRWAALEALRDLVAQTHDGKEDDDECRALAAVAETNP